MDITKAIDGYLGGAKVDEKIKSFDKDTPATAKLLSTTKELIQDFDMVTTDLHDVLYKRWVDAEDMHYDAAAKEAELKSLKAFLTPLIKGLEKSYSKMK